MNILEKREMTALAIVMLSAVAWLTFSVYDFFAGSMDMVILLEGGIVGCVLVALGLISYRWRHIGGWTLVFAGIAPILNSISRSGAPFLPVIIVGVPCILSGILFLLDQ